MEFSDGEGGGRSGTENFDTDSDDDEAPVQRDLVPPVRRGELGLVDIFVQGRRHSPEGADNNPEDTHQSLPQQE
jgi:hypothetical protein